MYPSHTLPSASHGLRIMHAAYADTGEKGAGNLLAGRRGTWRGTGVWLGRSSGCASAGGSVHESGGRPKLVLCVRSTGICADGPSRREHFAWEREARTNRRSSRSRASAATPSRTSGSAGNGKVGGPAQRVVRGIRAHLVCSRRAWAE